MKNASFFRALHAEAVCAGLKAGNACKPVAMIVSQHANPLNDASPVAKQWFVEGGACGFASISVRPGNSKFANWLKANGLGRIDSYAGGVCISVFEFGQSLERKEAYAHAFAKVLVEAGIRAYAESRMD